MRSFLRLLCALGATAALFFGSYPGIVVASSFAQLPDNPRFTLVALVPVFFMNANLPLLAVGVGLIAAWWLLGRRLPLAAAQ